MASATVRPAPGLEVFVVEDGYVVHDEVAGRVHHLNLTASLVYELADGLTDAAGVAAGVAEAFGLAAPPVEEVEACITQLLAEGVLTRDAVVAGDPIDDGATAGAADHASTHQSSDVA